MHVPIMEIIINGPELCMNSRIGAANWAIFNDQISHENTR